MQIADNFLKLLRSTKGLRALWKTKAVIRCKTALLAAADMD